VDDIKLLLRSLVTSKDPKDSIATIINSDKEYVDRVLNAPLSRDQFIFLKTSIKFVGVTRNFPEIIDYFRVPASETPAGFKIEYLINENNVLRIDLVRDISRDNTRLIICSMEGEDLYPAIDKLLTEPEFTDLTDRIIITAEPGYLAKFTTTPRVITYQRRFMNAAQGQKLLASD